MPPTSLRTTIDLPVRFAETDLMGVVHHSNYLIWFEAARVAWMDAAGVPYTEVAAGGHHFAVTAVQVEYRASARFGDTVRITAFVETLRSRKVDFGYDVHAWRQRRVAGHWPHRTHLCGYPGAHGADSRCTPGTADQGDAAGTMIDSMGAFQLRGTPARRGMRWAAGRLVRHRMGLLRRPPRACSAPSGGFTGGTVTRTNGEPTGQVSAGAVSPFVIVPLPHSAPAVDTPALGD